MKLPPSFQEIRVFDFCENVFVKKYVKIRKTVKNVFAQLESNEC